MKNNKQLPDDMRDIDKTCLFEGDTVIVTEKTNSVINFYTWVGTIVNRRDNFIVKLKKGFKQDVFKDERDADYYNTGDRQIRRLNGRSTVS